MQVERRVDWWRVIVDLERAGFTHERVAAVCMRSKPWVANLKNTPGTEPRYRDGRVLLSLWTEATSRGFEEVPCLQS